MRAAASIACSCRYSPGPAACPSTSSPSCHRRCSLPNRSLEQNRRAAFSSHQKLPCRFASSQACGYIGGCDDRTEDIPEYLRMERLMSSGTNGTEKNKALVQQLQDYGVIRSKKVADVMEATDRGIFVPTGSPAYYDSPMAIGYNATISAPHMHAACLELLEENLQPGMRALDVGSGTGYLTACFAMMVGSEGRTVGVEHIPELAALSINNIKRSSAETFLKDGSLSIHVADGRLGWPELAPYDAIHVGAAAPEIPQPLIDQLKPGGRMVIPVGNIFQDLKVVDKKPDGSVSIRSETSVRYVPLTSREAQLNGR